MNLVVLAKVPDDVRSNVDIRRNLHQNLEAFVVQDAEQDHVRGKGGLVDFEVADQRLPSGIQQNQAGLEATVHDLIGVLLQVDLRHLLRRRRPKDPFQKRRMQLVLRFVIAVQKLCHGFVNFDDVLTGANGVVQDGRVARKIGEFSHFRFETHLFAAVRRIEAYVQWNV